MALAWPTYMPTVLREGYGFEQTDVVARTEMEGGPRRLRQIAPPGPETIPVTWFLDGPRMQLFKSWFQNFAASGAALIDLPIRTDGNAVEVQTVNFITPISWRLEGARYWRASATVQTRQPKGLSADEYNAIVAAGGPAVFTSGEDLYRIENIIRPNMS